MDRTVSFNNLLLLVFGSVNGHIPLHTFGAESDIVLVAMNLEKHEAARRKTTVSAKVSLDWESGGIFTLTRSFFRYITYVRKTHAVYLWTDILRVPTPEDPAILI